MAEPRELFASSQTEDGRYRLLIEAITDYAIYMLDPNGFVTSWNPGAQRLKGYAPAEIIGQHFSCFYTPQDRDTDLPMRALQRALRDGKFEAEGWRLRKDGTPFWAYVVIDPIHMQGGELVGFAKITRDLTERKAAEDAIRKSQEEFRLLVQGVTDYAICLLDKEGKVANWNLGAQRIKGYLPAEIIGSHFSRFYTDEDQATGAPQKALATVRNTGHFKKEGWRVRKDGSRFWAHVVIDAIRNDDGELLGYAKVTRDITELKKTQEQLEKTRDALFQAQKMDAIGQLTGGIAHDFNNLLMAIQGSLELMRKRLPDDARLRALLENALQGARRGSTLTSRMLAFARRQELKQEPINIPELVRGMTDLLQRSIGPSIEIETRFPLGRELVLADANQLEMALLNLVVNARDAMPDGGQIVIGAKKHAVRAGHPKLKPAKYICLSVKDSGTGMDEETLKRAAEPFFTTKGPGKGTGLGVSMVHGVTEQFGGCFTLKSKKGKGTTAEIWLPIADTKRMVVDKQASKDEPAEYRPLVVLAVDDDFLVLTNTVAMLEDLGHTALAASSGAEALDFLARNSVDLVITDQAMPNMKGVELANSVRQRWPQIPIIVATGYAELEAGAELNFARLSKPFTEAQLRREIERAALVKNTGP
jgi:PAS domain S-box-containing protein